MRKLQKRFVLATAPAILATTMLATTAVAQDAPPALDAAVRQMVEAAARGGDQAKINAVVAVAKETNPDSRAEIDAIVRRIAAERIAAEEARILEAGVLENWSGSGQLGGALSTGNSRTKSLTAGVTLERKGLAWRHRLNALVDLVDSDGGNDQERILAGYQIDYQYSDRLYVWTRAQYERNLQAGIARRFAESAGFGWRVIMPSPVAWDLEAGPAVRQTRYLDFSENQVAGRAASRFRWDLSGRATLTNESAVYWDKAGSVTNTAALTSKLVGSLSAQLSYSLSWEESPPAGRQNLDTTSRASLVYDF